MAQWSQERYFGSAVTVLEVRCLKSGVGKVLF